jgi:hypothetical protein
VTEKGQREKRETHTFTIRYVTLTLLLCTARMMDWIGVMDSLKARLYRSMVSTASLEQLFPNESAKNGAGERQIACKIRGYYGQISTNYHILTIIRYDNRWKDLDETNRLVILFSSPCGRVANTEMYNGAK